jgi:hypothetical protein
VSVARVQSGVRLGGQGKRKNWKHSAYHGNTINLDALAAAAYSLAEKIPGAENEESY